MDRPTDELVQRLLSSADERAEAGAERLIAEASAAAEAEVGALLKSAFTAAYLRRAVARLEGEEKEPGGRPVLREVPVEEVAGLACYIYCIARGGDAFSGIVGVDPAHEARVITHDGVAAVVSSVRPETFSDETMAEKVQDLEWVGEKVRAHDAVIKRAMEGGAVIPLRFGMLLRGDEEAEQFLRVHHDALSAELDRLGGKNEWGVKIFFRADVLNREGRQSGRDRQFVRQSDDAGSGKAYLLERTREDEARLRRREAVENCINVCRKQLAAVADESTQLALSRRLPGEANDDIEMIANDAYLVRDGRVDEFSRAIEALAARFGAEGFEFELTGPWPAYNFVRLEFAGAAP